ncbi:DNA cytosine methyltransferase [Salinicoccus hispanicus]|uniref:DNA (cytosine-5-)-methyltransferase n=1 Tax=Salinicoccus hispanicus TaxID=157225 RepID=A0A6N8U0P3_9STAP|nr:DNA cytosine methyltransferase [Salinicoccus hispanicus]MXQ51333.1 DNA (cytosine-5-)-methyltransferase [Salinicoccus hispanicus]
MNIIDLFSGAGGLSEGFRNEGFKNIAHVEVDKHASKTLRLREAFYYLKEQKLLHLYEKYLKNELSFEQLFSLVPSSIQNKVINKEINQKNINEILNDINNLKGDRHIHGIIGGPPCQAYSTIGRARNKDKLRTDERVYLFNYYIDFLKEFEPDFFVFENVKGLLSFKDHAGNLLLPLIKKSFQNALHENSYDIEFEIINSAEYGVPQNRERLIIFGKKKKFMNKSFFKSLIKYKESSLTLNELFSDLPYLKNGQSSNCYKCSAKNSIIKNYYRKFNLPLSQNVSRPNNENDLKIYQIIAEGKKQGKNIKYNDLPSDLIKHKNNYGFLDRFKALNGSGIAHTVVAHIAKDGHYYIHPDVKQNRSITVREAARIQSFPDDYYFEDSRTSAFRQIGNAVPPVLAQKFARVVRNDMYL